MNTLIVELFSTPPAQRVAWAIVHFLWQGLAVALALAIALRLLRNRQPQLRWAAACLALTLMALLPVATALRVAVSHTPPATSSLAPELNLHVAPQPPSPTYATYSPPPANASSADPAPSPANPKPPPPAFQPPYDLLRPALPWVLLAWLAGVFGMSLWHLGGWTLLQWTRRQCTDLPGPDLLALFQPLLQRLKVRRPIRLLQSPRVAVPAVVGWLRPAILLPVSLLSGLTPRQLEAVLAHEIAHILRNDYLISLIQAAVETLLFYHPAVWWVSARIRQEAEYCCDQQALRACPSPLDYAQALARVADLTRSQPHLAPAATGGKLLPRIRRVLGLSIAPARFSTRWLAAILALSFLICGGLAMYARSARAQDPAHPAPDNAPWGQPLNGLRTRLTAPANSEYQHDTPLTLSVQMQNVSDKPIAFSSLAPDVTIRADDQQGRWLGIPRVLINVSPWEGRSDSLAPGATITWQIPVAKFRFVRQVPAGTTIRLHTQGPTQTLVPGRLPVDLTSNTIDLVMKDAPPSLLKATDLPEEWAKSMELVYRYEPGLRREARCALHIDGQGQATLITAKGNQASPPPGRTQAKLTSDRLNRLVKLLRDQQVWNMEQLKEIAYPDEPELRLCVISGPAAIVADLPMHVVAKQPAIQAIQQEMQSLMREVAAPAERAPAASPPPANSLQTRIVFKRKGPVFHRDEPIEPKVLVKNTSDRPVLYDARPIDLAHKGTWTLFGVVGPDGKPAPNIAAQGQVRANQAKYDYPTLAPGQEIEIDAARLDMRYYYMGKPGKYRITWPGTQLAPPDPTLLSGQGPKAWDAALYQAQKIASGIPPADSVEITVRAPDDPQDVDAVGRVLSVLPPGWRINGASLSASGPRPGGPQPGHAWRISLLHSPVPGVLDNLALMDLLFSSQPASREDWEYLGRGRLGHVYLTLQHAAPLSRWHHATYDLAVALEVADPPPKQPPGPDWGRMVSHIMTSCAAEHTQADSIARFCRSAELTDGRKGKPLISCADNLVPATKTKPAARQHPDRPYYEVALSVRPIDRSSQLKLAESDAFIRWDRQSSVYGVEVKRLNVEIVITVRSDDPDFAQRLNAIFTREITRVLMDTKTAASIKPAVGAKMDRAEVIRIATRQAEDTSRDLINYAAPRVSFDPQTKRWTVLFNGIVDPAPGNHFSVFVDDQTAAATLAPGR